MLKNGYEQIIVPNLPKWKKVKKYVDIIDKTHLYSNFGLINQTFKNELENRWDKLISIIPTSSGTTALIGAILANKTNIPDHKQICILPSYTFVATINAVISCGFIPYLMDIELDSWDMNINDIENLNIFEEIGLIVPVSIYGKNVNIEKWEKFNKKHNIAIVIDAAASFDTISVEYLKRLKNISLCLSFHATKVFGIGEGGCIMKSKETEDEPFFRAINFGFYQSRESYGFSINGKMSEYHAAIGLASIDSWEKKIKKLNSIRKMYFDLSTQYNIYDNIICGNNISLAYCLYLNKSHHTKNYIRVELTKQNIDFRFWYEDGLHSHPAYKKIKHQTLKNTSKISKLLIGIPMHEFLKKEDINHVTKSLAGL